MNMSYCRFQNTANDLADCINAIADYNEEYKDESISEREKMYAKNLYKLCQEYIEEYECQFV